MTMCEVSWRLLRISNRKKEETKFIVALHDKELKKEEKIAPITEDQESAMEKAIEKAKLRKAKEYGKRR